MATTTPRATPLDRLRLPAETASSKVDKRTIEDAFPNVDPGIRPCGEKITVQLRTPLHRTSGGVLIADESRETEMWNEQTGIVRYVGPLSFKNRTTQEPWPEGAWCKPGDFVRIPKYHADRIQVSTGPLAEDIALFVTLKDSEVIAIVTGDPLAIKAFV